METVKGSKNKRKKHRKHSSSSSKAAKSTAASTASSSTASSSGKKRGGGAGDKPPASKRSSWSASRGGKSSRSLGCGDRVSYPVGFGPSTGGSSPGGRPLIGICREMGNHLPPQWVLHMVTRGYDIEFTLTPPTSILPRQTELPSLIDLRGSSVGDISAVSQASDCPGLPSFQGGDLVDLLSGPKLKDWRLTSHPVSGWRRSLLGYGVRSRASGQHPRGCIPTGAGVSRESELASFSGPRARLRVVCPSGCRRLRGFLPAWCIQSQHT
jgi:hypothetical protein